MPTPANEPAVGRARDADETSIFSTSSYASSSDIGSPARRRTKQAIRLLSFVSATLCALCGGSIVVFSLWAPVFQSRLHYTQFQVNGVATAGSISLYLPISILGYVCDRHGTAPLAVLSTILFSVGYGLAAGVYRHVDLQYRAEGPDAAKDDSYYLMVLAFVCIGAATCAIYMASVSSCAKNFGKGRYRGLALATPITAFGLSPMWLSQVGSRLFVERREDGSDGDLQVFRFFIFLGCLLFVVSGVAIFALRVVDENDLIDEAIDELEHSGLLDGSSLLGRSYSAITQTEDQEAALLDPTKDEDAQWKKNWVLNAETRQFLTDRTMWPFAAAFLLLIGPGEAFVNNMGTVIGTLTPPSLIGFAAKTSAATHVSIFGVTSTLSRILIGTLTDLLAPSPQTQHVQMAPQQHQPFTGAKRFSISRVVFMLFFALMLSFGLLFLASGAVQNHAERFWVVSGFVGLGYGAVFSLTPLIVTIIWGVENFSTNFGIIAMLPAVGSTFWGLVYSSVYQAGAHQSALAGDGEGVFCYGKHCYASTYWAETITVWVGMGLLLLAWKGPGGWQERNIVI